MAKRTAFSAELKSFGKQLLTARIQQGLSQKELAVRSGISQPRVSGIEKGKMLPTLPQLMSLARVLVLPVQWFLSGSVYPGQEIPDFALQLQWLGVVDLLVPEAAVPGAFRPTEQVLALAVDGNQPNPRIIEAIPAVLAWNRWFPSLLREYSRPRTSRTCIRLAWLADVALTIHRTTGFPGGCPQYRNLELFVGPLLKAQLVLKDDDLGRPGEEGNLSPVSRRWKISYDAPLSKFVERAQHLNFQQEQRHLRKHTSTETSDE